MGRRSVDIRSSYCLVTGLRHGGMMWGGVCLHSSSCTALASGTRAWGGLSVHIFGPVTVSGIRHKGWGAARLSIWSSYCLGIRYRGQWGARPGRHSPVQLLSCFRWSGHGGGLLFIRPVSLSSGTGAGVQFWPSPVLVTVWLQVRGMGAASLSTSVQLYYFRHGGIKAFCSSGLKLLYCFPGTEAVEVAGRRSVYIRSSYRLASRHMGMGGLSTFGPVTVLASGTGAWAAFLFTSCPVNVSGIRYWGIAAFCRHSVQLSFLVWYGVWGGLLLHSVLVTVLSSGTGACKALSHLRSSCLFWFQVRGMGRCSVDILRPVIVLACNGGMGYVCLHSPVQLPLLGLQVHTGMEVVCLHLVQLLVLSIRYWGTSVLSTSGPVTVLRSGTWGMGAVLVYIWSSYCIGFRYGGMGVKRFCLHLRSSYCHGFRHTGMGYGLLSYIWSSYCLASSGTGA
ncbi:hypothetical protein AVEN_182118-1 [Araneus ventricosus]|uniref:Uncharacterized protein n=1 Tax=Araneus ventricosus TaxID=182803 RepID=A0A4Y2UHP5_ARAVE|nr:hypothetical protein AVEN_182118-1 [Araneus ventricosus]